MAYEVCYRFNGEYDVEVNAANKAEAKEIAKDKYYEADFGEAEDIEIIDIYVSEIDTDKYNVCIEFTARYTTFVEADNLEEADEIAEERYTDADFGEARDIDGELCYIEDEDGERVVDNT